MSTNFAIITLIELFIGILLVYGFMHEDKVISFEQAVKRIVIGNFKRIVRKIHNAILDRKVMKFYDEICRKDFNQNGLQDIA